MFLSTDRGQLAVPPVGRPLALPRSEQPSSSLNEKETRRRWGARLRADLRLIGVRSADGSDAHF